MKKKYPPKNQYKKRKLITQICPVVNEIDWVISVTGGRTPNVPVCLPEPGQSVDCGCGGAVIKINEGGSDRISVCISWCGGEWQRDGWHERASRRQPPSPRAHGLDPRGPAISHLIIGQRCSLINKALLLAHCCGTEHYSSFWHLIGQMKWLQA